MHIQQDCWHMVITQPHSNWHVQAGCQLNLTLAAHNMATAKQVCALKTQQRAMQRTHTKAQRQSHWDPSIVSPALQAATCRIGCWHCGWVMMCHVSPHTGCSLLLFRHPGLNTPGCNEYKLPNTLCEKYALSTCPTRTVSLHHHVALRHATAPVRATGSSTTSSATSLRPAHTAIKGKWTQRASGQ